jgi:homoserine O-acetyltransferase/O-succinyltransferase
LEAMMSLDVSRDFDGSMKKAAANVKASVLVIVSKQDHTVTPQPALDFAATVHAKTLVLDSDCGHGAPFCEADLVSHRVNEFLEH